jgi:FtsP/CotA-like multicopper oxidase with cupredoxin domain
MEYIMRRYGFISFAVLVLLSVVVVSCGSSSESDGGSKSETDIERNPYNILNYQPKNSYEINITKSMFELRRGAPTETYQYETGLPGGMIIVPKGEPLTFHVENQSIDSTSLHWHGLRVPIEQDGPGKIMNKSETADFAFTLDMTGTHWYHPHLRPILPQLNTGLYAPFIVKEEYDSSYAGDYVLTLDDWTLNPLTNEIDFNYSVGTDVVGNLETVNKRSGGNIYPITLKQGEIVKLRFINASTAQTHTLSLSGHMFRITHLDGHKLLEPYTTQSIRLAPGERVDAELNGIKSSGTYYIRNTRSYGMRIPVIYEGVGEDMESPFIPGESEAFPGLEGKAVDKEFILSSDSSGWTINGSSFPTMDIFTAELNKIYIFRFNNIDPGKGMSTRYHPMHLHGGHFQVISINGMVPEREMWKDTLEIPPNQYIDIAVKFYYPGDWMLHCHIIDHEDGGMLTMVHVPDPNGGSSGGHHM